MTRVEGRTYKTNLRVFFHSQCPRHKCNSLLWPMGKFHLSLSLSLSLSRRRKEKENIKEERFIEAAHLRRKQSIFWRLMLELLEPPVVRGVPLLLLPLLLVTPLPLNEVSCSHDMAKFTCCIVSALA